MCRSGRSQGSVPRRRCSWLGWGSSRWWWMLVRGRRRRPGFGSFVRLAVARPVILGPPARTGASRARSLLCRRSVRAVRDGYRRVGGTLAGMRTGTSGGCRSTRNSPHRAGRLPVPVPAAAPSRRADTTPRPSALTLMGFLPFGFIFDAFLPVRDHRWLGSPVFPGRKGPSWYLRAVWLSRAGSPCAGVGVAGQRPAADIGAEELGRGGGRREVIAGAGGGGPAGATAQGTHRAEGQGKSQRRALDHASAWRTQAGPRSWREFVMDARLFAFFPFMKTRQAAGKAVPLAAAPARQFLSGCRRWLFVALLLPRAAAMRNSSIGAQAAARRAGC